MELRQSSPDRSEPRPSPDQRRRLQVALRQVEWADTYLNAVAGLELHDHDLNYAVDDIRTRLVAVELQLRKLIAR